MKNLKKWFISIIVLISLLCSLVVYFSLNTSPDEELIIAFLEARSSYCDQIQNRFSILIDYRKPVFKKRLWVIDSNTGEVYLNAHVGHAFKSGLIVPSKFSNTPETELSSYGCFLTKESYYGKYGLSMKISGLESGINDNVGKRSIIFHGYSPPVYSRGCFITWPSVNNDIIELTKNGSFVFVHK